MARTNASMAATITVRFFKGNLSWVWVGQADGQPYNAVAVLTRQ